ncbi:U-Kazal-Dg21.2-like [Lucilia cuprina]|uniref:U-Kazal-Dg21.2-like n=1 Tax=Lucilia cuprina TaxID=7375 RepID=UPI001F051F4C|nr:U-Kazal-Dg21.2-like [Lucilia cuprina]
MLSIKNIFFGITIVGMATAEYYDIKDSLTEKSFEFEKPAGDKNAVEFPELIDYNDNCLRACPRILDPICAVDEMNPQEHKYFHNQCLMEYDNCRQSRAWKPTQMLLCIKDIDPVVRDDCMRACPLIYNPVCASDGKNYEIFGNRCSFGMENCLASGKWLEVRAEQCGL